LQTDIKRARFRADSSPADDKLVSCIRLNCHGVRDALPRRANKRRRVERDPADNEDDAASSGTDDSGVAEIARGVGAIGKKGSVTASPKKPKSRRESDGAPSVAGSSSAKKRARPRKQATPAKGKEKATDNTGEKPSGDSMDVDDEPATAAVSTPAKKPRARPRKQSTKDKGKDKDGAETGAESDAPARGRKPRAKTPQLEVVLRSRSQSRVSRVRAAATEVDGGDAPKADEDRKRKKRKVVAPA